MFTRVWMSISVITNGYKEEENKNVHHVKKVHTKRCFSAEFTLPIRPVNQGWRAGQNGQNPFIGKTAAEGGKSLSNI